MAKPSFAFTIDLEPDWGISGSKAVQEVLPRFCDLLADHNVRATFFVVTSLLDECPTLLKHCLAKHEIASHGLTHRRLDGLGELDALAEMRDSRLRLESFFNRPVEGFRAPFLRPAQGDWFRLVRQAGYTYDSSIGQLGLSFKTTQPDAWRVERHDGVVELPITTLRGGALPFNLTWLRLLNPATKHLMHPDARMFFLHLHELADPHLARVLPLHLRMPLRRKAGQPAWGLFARVLQQYAAQAVTCMEMAEEAPFD